MRAPTGEYRPKDVAKPRCLYARLKEAVVEK